MQVRFTVRIIVPSLKNQKRTRRGQSGMFDSSEIKIFKRDFPNLVPREYRNLRLGSRKKFLWVSIRLIHKDWRRDADVAIVLDCLQLAGVISNDRWCRKISIDAVTVDPEAPRAEIIIEELEYGAP